MLLTFSVNVLLLLANVIDDHVRDTLVLVVAQLDRLLGSGGHNRRRLSSTSGESSLSGIAHVHLLILLGTHALCWRAIQQISVQAILELNVGLLDANNRLGEQAERLVHMILGDLLAQVHASERLAQANHRLELTHRDAPRRLVRALPLPQLLVLGDHDLLGLDTDLGLAQSRKGDVLVNVGHGVDTRLLDHLCVTCVEVDDSLGDPVVDHLVALVDQDEEQVEAGHDRCAHVDVVAERLAAIVLAVDRVGGGQDARASVQRGANARLGDADRLLFHGLVNGHLVLQVHLVELVDAADAVVGEHERARLDHELEGLFVAGHGRRQAGRRARLAACVDGARGKLLHLAGQQKKKEK